MSTNAYPFEPRAKDRKLLKYLPIFYIYKQQNIFNSTALRKTKIVYTFGLSECNRVNGKNTKCKYQHSSSVDNNNCLLEQLTEAVNS